MNVRRQKGLIVGLLLLQRLAELRLSKRNEQVLRAAGAVESGQRHYPLMLALHAGWFAGLWWEGRRSAAPVRWKLLPAALALQGVRLASMQALGPRWTTRILVLPGEAPVQRGPYRFTPHPNYLAVMLELFLLPWMLDARRTALLGGSLNLLLLNLTRMPAENRALSQASSKAGNGPRPLTSGSVNG